MPTFEEKLDHDTDIADAVGVLVVNLGTPEAPTTSAVRRFLRQFLWDPRVVDYPRVLWWLILNLVILLIRPPQSAKAYREIWTERGSPLMFHCQDIVSAMQQRMSRQSGETVHVELAMTYGNPGIESGLSKLRARGARRIVILPLYPQYSGTTTASVRDAAIAALGEERFNQDAQFIDDYYDVPGYVAAAAASIREHWERNGRGDHLLFSFHGLPQRNVDNGDPYQEQCLKTAALITQFLQLQDDDWSIAFQSRVGREVWLKPYTEEVLQEFGAAKMQRVDVACPGFSVDCLETLEEIEIRNAADFVAAGGGSLSYIPALNARDDHVAFLTELVTSRARNWQEVAA